MRPVLTILRFRKPPEEVNADAVEMEANAPKSRAKTNVDPEDLDRQVRVSRNVEEHELENALRPMPQHGAKMKELLLRLFNLDGR